MKTPTNPSSSAAGLRRADRLAGLSSYRVARKRESKLRLDCNEGPPPPASWLAAVVRRGVELARRYPDLSDLESILAERLGVDRRRLLITAGGDDGLLRSALAFLDANRRLVLPVPTFEMFARYAQLAGAPLAEVAWEGDDFPAEDVFQAISAAPGMLAVVSPNNPTGRAVGEEIFRELCRAAASSPVLADLAYAEFADVDLTGVASECERAIAIRTFSKAWGLAGLRVGYVLAAPDLIESLRAAGNPYAVSGLSAAIAAEAVAGGGDLIAERVAVAREERDKLDELLRSLGQEPIRSQANFVAARFFDAARVAADLAERGIAVRSFSGHPRLSDYLRLTCPIDAKAFSQLSAALEHACRASV